MPSAWRRRGFAAIGGELPGGSAAVIEGGAAAAYLCIHFPHKLSPLARAMLAHPNILAMLTRLIGPNVKCMQSMLFIKHAGKPGQAWHQDEDFIPTRDRSLTAAWIALDDATVDNGCLWAIPGSHRPGVLWPLRQHDNPEYDSIPEAFNSPTRKTTRDRSKSRRARSCSLTATYCTSRCVIVGRAAFAERW
jgi:hypothetical protein